MRTYAQRSSAFQDPRKPASTAPLRASGKAGVERTPLFQPTLRNQALHSREEGRRAVPTVRPGTGGYFDLSGIPAHPRIPDGIQVRTTEARYPFRTTIRRDPSMPVVEQVRAADSRMDAPSGEEHGGERYLALFEQLGEASTAEAVPENGLPDAVAGPELSSPDGASESAGPDAPISVPDIEIPALAELEKTDDVDAAFTYSGSIRRAGAAPSGFGVTRSFNSRLSQVTITPGAGTFEVAATLKHPITYQVRARTGPGGQVDIPSETAAAITAANYATVASDLTPDMSDLNGRPPRTRFWARDLTIRHELVHANDDQRNGPGAMATVTTWLNGQTAASVRQVRRLLRAIPGRFASALLAALSTREGEERAYGDGAPSYRARAEAVQTKGDNGDYA